MRSVGNRVADSDDEEEKQLSSSSPSSGSMNAIDWEPFKMDFTMSEEETAGLRDAFTRYMDPKDSKISFNELFHDLKAIDIKRKQPLLYEILERVLDFPEI